MPNIARDNKFGKSVDTSDLLAAMKRNTLIAVARSKDAGLNKKSLIKQQGFNTGFLDMVSKNGLDLYNASKTSAVNVTGTSNGGLIGTMRFVGYNLLGLTDADKTAFKNAFALQYGIDPNLLTLSFAAGSLIIGVSANPVLNVRGLSRRAKAFFANSESIIRGIQPITIERCVTLANIPTSRLSVTATIQVDISYTGININLDLITNCQTDSEFQQNLTDIVNPMVGDPINDCMYTLIDGTTNKIIVRINKNGSADRICDYPDSSGYFFRHIFINAESTYLIIPSNNADTLSPLASQPNQPKANKVYLINISNGAVSTIILTDLNGNLSHGFDKLTRRFFYSSYMASNDRKLCYVTIPANYSSATLTATYYSNITLSSASKIEFIDSNNAYSVGRGLDIVKYDLSVANGSSTHIAGLEPSQLQAGWTNNLVNNWGTSTYGPYLDAPIGSNAFFSLIQDICYDSENNRILVADYGAQRIRSVDLTPGNNYAVTTLAGTSPTFLGLAINRNGSTYSQGLLNSLAQVGEWGSNNMPAYVKVNGTYLTSTFQKISGIIFFNKKIYVLSSLTNTKQLSNGYVTDFLVSKNF